MSANVNRDFILGLKEKFRFNDVEFTWTSMIIESVINPDHTPGGQNVLLEFSITDRSSSSNWSLILPADYHDYLSKHPDTCSFQTSGTRFQVIDLNLESMSAPVLKMVCTRL